MRSVLKQYGTTPFKGANRNTTFQNILHNEVTFPDHPEVSNNAKNLIRKLLHKDERKRMGSKAGASDVKQHPFFRGINWALLRHQRPPIIPRVRDPLDTSNFRRLEESVSLDLDNNNVANTANANANWTNNGSQVVGYTGEAQAAVGGPSNVNGGTSGSDKQGKEGRTGKGWKEDQGRDPFLEFDSGGFS